MSFRGNLATLITLSCWGQAVAQVGAEFTFRVLLVAHCVPWELFGTAFDDVSYPSSGKIDGVAEFGYCGVRGNWFGRSGLVGFSALPQVERRLCYSLTSVYYLLCTRSFLIHFLYRFILEVDIRLSTFLRKRTLDFHSLSDIRH